MVRLFRAWSVIDEYLGQNNVKFNWFVAGRPKPIIPYEMLIEDFDETDEESCYDKILVNEYLTLEEVEELRGYLSSSHDLDVHVEEVSLPIRPGGLSYGLLLISGEKGFYSLADEEGYKLSVSILGYFKLMEDKLSGLLSDEDIQSGTNFLKKIFKNLNLPEFEEVKLIEVLNKIYEETGLFVQKDTKKSERTIGKSINN